MVAQDPVQADTRQHKCVFNLLRDHFNWIADIGRVAGCICIPYIYNGQKKKKNSSEVGTAGTSRNKSLAEEGKIGKSFKDRIRNNYAQKHKSTAIEGDDCQADRRILILLPYVRAEGTSPPLPPRGSDGWQGVAGRHCGNGTCKWQSPSSRPPRPTGHTVGGIPQMHVAPTGLAPLLV